VQGTLQKGAINHKNNRLQTTANCSISSDQLGQDKLGL